jgi:hypothetical protein
MEGVCEAQGVVEVLAAVAVCEERAEVILVLYGLVQP